MSRRNKAKGNPLLKATMTAQADMIERAAKTMDAQIAAHKDALKLLDDYTFHPEAAQQMVQQFFVQSTSTTGARW